MINVHGARAYGICVCVCVFLLQIVELIKKNCHSPFDRILSRASYSCMLYIYVNISIDQWEWPHNSFVSNFTTSTSNRMQIVSHKFIHVAWHLYKRAVGSPKDQHNTHIHPLHSVIAIWDECLRHTRDYVFVPHSQVHRFWIGCLSFCHFCTV